jgi:hypothetical protein
LFTLRSPVAVDVQDVGSNLTATPQKMVEIPMLGMMDCWVIAERDRRPMLTRTSNNPGMAAIFERLMAEVVGRRL